MDSLIYLGSPIPGFGFWEGGISLEDLAIFSMNPEELKAYLQNG